MKKKYILGVSLLSALALVSCRDKKSSIEINYNVKVVDIDGEELFNKDLKTFDSKSLLNDLKKETTVVSEDSQYGTLLKSIAGSVIDKNYYLAIYENDQYASTGIDGLDINEGDNFKFQVECWNTKEKNADGGFDLTDVLVDKIIYHYAKKYLPDLIASDTSYKTSNFWNYLFTNLAKNSGYDDVLYDVTSAKAELSQSVIDEDFSTMAIPDYGKYYYVSKALGLSLDNFKPKYQEFINSIQTDYSLNYAEYSLPFGISPAKALNVTSDNLETLLNTTYRCSTEYGTDSLAWQIGALGIYDKATKEDLANLTASVEISYVYDSNYNITGSYKNATSTALKLISYAALGENPRADEYKLDGHDLVENLVNTFYDEINLALKYRDDQEFKVEYSTPQIYASLLAYKVERDSGEKTFLFA